LTQFRVSRQKGVADDVCSRARDVKKQINPSIKAHLLRSALILLSLLAICAIPFALAQSRNQSQLPTKNSNSPEENIVSPAPLQPSAATHETRAGLQEMIEFPNANEVTPRIETVSPAPPTRRSFMATWGTVSGAKGYLLDISTSNSFSSYVDGYHDLDVGNVNGLAVTGLNPGTTYYYRMRPYTDGGSGGYSSVMTATTEAPIGLIIHPTFDSTITNNPNAAAIEAMINRAIGIYESLFNDPITIEILFRYSDSAPAPSPSPFPPGVLSSSLSTIYTVSWNDFISHLRADARTGKDNVANASLPGSPLSTNIAPSSANGRAVGLNTLPAMFPNGTIGPGGPFDGIVTLNSAQPFSFSRPLFFGSFDAQRATEHEIDEVMGLGSYLNTRNAPRPCTSYEAESSDNTIAGGAVIQSCPACSGGEDVGFVGNNSGTLQFNRVAANASGRLNVTIWYTNGDAVRYALLSVNGSPGTPLSFPSTGSFQTVGSIQTTITNLIPGSNNTLKFYNPIVGNWAPDFDRIEVNCTIPPPATLRPQDLFSWSSPGVRNLTVDGLRYFSIDSGSTNIIGFNQSPPGDFGDWLSEACPQHHPFVQNAFVCRDQFFDISATSPEGINLDVIGYDLVDAPAPTPTPTPGRRATVGDFNGDGHPDYVVQNASTHQTAIWYLNNTVFIGGAFGPTLAAGWGLRGAADCNSDGHPDYPLFAPSTLQTAIWYLSGPIFIYGAYGPTLPSGWALVITADFNGDGKPDYALYNTGTRQTAIWYMNNNLFVSGAYGPTLPVAWSLVGVADFNGDGHPDYALFNSTTRQTAIWYLSGPTFIWGAYGPTLPTGWAFVATADFNGDGKPDYLLYNAGTRQTAIWYMNNNVFVSGAYGPTLPAGWSLVGQ
jgi:FG-GAP-like repeat